MDTLPISTLPRPDESGLSWLLRLTEGNMLHSPWPLLRLMGMLRPNMSHLSVDLGKAAQLCGLDEHAIEAQRCVALPDGRKISFFGHHIEHHALRNGAPVVCPKCIESLGYARALWDLRLVTTCPEHRIALANRCGSCGGSLSWLRPRLSVCRCGAMLDQVQGEPVNEAMLAVSAVLECCMVKSTEPWTSRMGPANELVQEISQMSLDEAQTIIRWLARLASGARTSSLRYDADKITRAVGPILCDWPAGFHAALDAHVDLCAQQTRGGESAHNTDSPIQWVLSCRRNLRKLAVTSKRSNDSILDTEIVRFVKLRFDDAVIDSRVAKVMQANGIQPRWVSAVEAARRLKIDPRTLQRLIAEGRLACRRVQHDKGERFYICTDQLSQDFASTRVLRLAGVTHALGLPQVVVVSLRSTGTLGGQERDWRKTSISELDVGEFRQRWAKVKAWPKPRGVSTISLHEAFRAHIFGLNVAWKAESIRRVLDGRLRAYVVRADTIIDASVSIEDLERIKDEHRQKRLTLGGAGHALKVSKMNVLKLVVDGHIGAILSETEIGFERSEIARFSERYVQVLKAKGHSARSGELVKFCDRHQIPVIRAGGGNCPTVFVPREFAKKVAGHMGKAFTTLDRPTASQPGFYAAKCKGGRKAAGSVRKSGPRVAARSRAA